MPVQCTHTSGKEMVEDRGGQEVVVGGVVVCVCVRERERERGRELVGALSPITSPSLYQYIAREIEREEGEGEFQFQRRSSIWRAAWFFCWFFFWGGVFCCCCCFGGRGGGEH